MTDYATLNKWLRRPLYGFVDESGDMGTSERSSEELASALVVVEDTDELRRIHSHWPKNTKHYPKKDDELKFITSTDEVIGGYLEELIDIEPEIFVVRTSKIGDDSVSRSGRAMLIENAGELLYMASDEFDNPIYLVFDRNSALKGTDAALICKKATDDGNTIWVCSKYNANSKEYPELTAPDMVAGSSRRLSQIRQYPDENEREELWREIKNNTKMKKR